MIKSGTNDLGIIILKSDSTFLIYSFVGKCLTAFILYKVSNDSG